MEITTRGVARLVSQEIGVPDTTSAESKCGMMEAIARLEGVRLQRHQLMAAAAIGAAMRAFDDGFDECPLEVANEGGG